MSTVHLVFGPQGAGKSTHARAIAERVGGVRFSIDEWMVQLYGPDAPSPMRLDWVMTRVGRCEEQIWSVAREIAQTGGAVILDLGFMKRSRRAEFVGLCETAGLNHEVHYVDAPRDVRRRRVLARNADQGETFSLEVTPEMFDFMETQFEAPRSAELSEATVVNTDSAARVD